MTIHTIEVKVGWCAGCGERIRFPRGRWAHRRCALVLMRHRAPFTLTDWVGPMLRGWFGRLDGADLEDQAETDRIEAAKRRTTPEGS